MKFSIRALTTLRRTVTWWRSPDVTDPEGARRPVRASQRLGAIEPGEAGLPEYAEQDSRLREELDQLTPEERTVLIRQKAGFSPSEIARHRGGSVGGVAKLLASVKKSVRRLSSRDSSD